MNYFVRDVNDLCFCGGCWAEVIVVSYEEPARSSAGNVLKHLTNLKLVKHYLQSQCIKSLLATMPQIENGYISVILCHSDPIFPGVF